VPKPTRRDACYTRADVSMQRAATRRAINDAGGVPPANLVC